MRRLVAAGMCTGLTTLLGACGDSDPQAAAPASQHAEGGGEAGEQAGVGANPTARRTGPLPDGGAAGCVEQYSPAAVTNRAFAFDGVVVRIGAATTDHGDSDLGLAGVTFTVREWFAGGSGSTVTVDMQPPVEDAGLSESGPAYGIGSRLLVSGEPRWGGPALADPIAWGCQFTRYYDPDTAEAWDQAFADRG